MWRSLLVLVLLSGLAAASSLQRGPREKKTGFAPGLATIVGTLGLLKIKAIFVSLIVFAVAAVFMKLLGGGCTGGGDLGCNVAALLPTAHSNVGGYNYDTYSGTGSGGYNYYNHRRSARGWDILDLSLEVLGLESEDCKKKFICLADNEALENPLLQLLMAAFGGSLDKYRDSAEAAETTTARDCDKLFPSCVKTLSRGKTKDKTSPNKPTDKLPRGDKDKNIHR